jgi:D-arabinose 1-dehydrogenase-like Zn-dependent alcohol dehydrogenase
MRVFVLYEDSCESCYFCFKGEVFLCKLLYFVAGLAGLGDYAGHGGQFIVGWYCCCLWVGL